MTKRSKNVPVPSKEHGKRDCLHENMSDPLRRASPVICFLFELFFDVRKTLDSRVVACVIHFVRAGLKLRTHRNEVLAENQIKSHHGTRFEIFLYSDIIIMRLGGRTTQLKIKSRSIFERNVFPSSLCLN